MSYDQFIYEFSRFKLYVLFQNKLLIFKSMISQ